MKLVLKLGVAALCLVAFPVSSPAEGPSLLPAPAVSGCALLPDHSTLSLALAGAVTVET